jgi:hypothetical protein
VSQLDDDSSAKDEEAKADELFGMNENEKQEQDQEQTTMEDEEL